MCLFRSLSRGKCVAIGYTFVVLFFCKKLSAGVYKPQTGGGLFLYEGKIEIRCFSRFLLFSLIWTKNLSPFEVVPWKR